MAALPDVGVTPTQNRAIRFIQFLHPQLKRRIIGAPRECFHNNAIYLRSGAPYLGVRSSQSVLPLSERLSLRSVRVVRISPPYDVSLYSGIVFGCIMHLHKRGGLHTFSRHLGCYLWVLPSRISFRAWSAHFPSKMHLNKATERHSTCLITIGSIDP